MKILEDYKKIKGKIETFPNELLSNGQAMDIHNQSLKKLNERGGMSVAEILMNIFGLEFFQTGNFGSFDEQLKLLMDIVKVVGIR